MMEYTVGSLFAGVGGICLGFRNAGVNNQRYKLVWANEIDDYAAYTYQQNFNHSLIVGDIEKIVMPEREDDLNIREGYYHKQEEILNQKIDILTGGFPCQAFSIAGYRKGFDDHRGNLFLSIIDLIKLLKVRHNELPKVLFLENVKNLMNHDEGETYKHIKNELEVLGYKVKERVLNTKDFSALPQNRERIYIVGFLNHEVADNFRMFEDEVLETFKIKKSDEEKKKYIEDILDLNITNNEHPEYYYTKEKYPHYFVCEDEYNNIEDSKKKEVRVNLKEQINEEYQFYQVRRGMYVRKNMNGVCPTLTANMGTGGHNVPLIKVKDGIRKLTPTETFKLQGFPIGDTYKLPTLYNGKKYSDARLYKQAGNAVSVDVITLIAKEILKALDMTNRIQG
jgi:DNA (cytosine-5)-methyltransferase 1